MRKKAKSFAVDEEAYNELNEIFKENYVEVSISYCINRYIKEYLSYLKTVRKEIQQDSSYTVPMSFIIETMAREPIFKRFDSEISAKAEADSLQNKYDTYIKKYPEKAKEFDIDAIEGKLPLKDVVGLFIRAYWEEIKNKGMTDDEVVAMIRNYGEEKGIGGKAFQKGIRTKLKPMIEKLTGGPVNNKTENRS
jgi:hypothetical protein